MAQKRGWTTISFKLLPSSIKINRCMSFLHGLFGVKLFVLGSTGVGITSFFLGGRRGCTPTSPSNPRVSSATLLWTFSLCLSLATLLQLCNMFEQGGVCECAAVHETKAQYLQWPWDWQPWRWIIFMIGQITFNTTNFPAYYWIMFHMIWATCRQQHSNWLNIGVSKNRGTPKWMVYNGKPY